LLAALPDPCRRPSSAAAAVIGGLVWWRSRVRRRTRAAGNEHDIGKVVDDANDAIDTVDDLKAEMKGSTDEANDRVDTADVAASGVGAALNWLNSS
jgi:hypothetical protein